MKFIHTSDWHVGQRFYRYERDDEHMHFFTQLAQIMREEHPDLLVVSGDIYDTSAPSAQSQRLLVQGVLDLHEACPEAAIVITAGNHDSGSRLEAAKRLWRHVGVTVIGSCQRQENGTFCPEQFIVEVPGKCIVAAVPHFSKWAYPAANQDVERDDRQKAFFQSILDAANARNAEGLPVVLMAHLAVSGSDFAGQESLEAIGGIETDDVSVLGQGYDYLALGHIHKPQSVGFNHRVRYCGSPIPMSFAEEYQHFVDIVEIDSHRGVPRLRQVMIEPLRSVISIPEGGAPIEDALKALADLDDKCTAYVRVLVDDEKNLPPESDDRANALARDKACRYCEIKKVTTPQQVRQEMSSRVLEISEIRSLSPLDLALEAYQRGSGVEMPEDLQKLLSSVIQEVTK